MQLKRNLIDNSRNEHQKFDDNGRPALVPYVRQRTQWILGGPEVLKRVAEIRAAEAARLEEAQKQQELRARATETALKNSVDTAPMPEPVSTFLNEPDVTNPEQTHTEYIEQLSMEQEARQKVARATEESLPVELPRD